MMTNQLNVSIFVFGIGFPPSFTNDFAVFHLFHNCKLSSLFLLKAPRSPGGASNAYRKLVSPPFLFSKRIPLEG